MDTEKDNQQKDDGYTGHSDLPLVNEGLGPIPFIMSAGGAAVEGLVAHTAAEALGNVAQDWLKGQISDRIVEHLLHSDHTSMKHSGDPSQSHDTSQGHDSHNATPHNANMTDLPGPDAGIPHVPEHPTGPDGHNMTPYDANYTDPQGHAAHSSSPNAGLPPVPEHPTGPDTGLPHVLEHPNAFASYDPSSNAVASHGSAHDAFASYDPSSNAVASHGSAHGAFASYDPSSNAVASHGSAHDAFASYDPSSNAVASHGSAHDASASYGSAHDASASHGSAH